MLTGIMLRYGMETYKMGISKIRQVSSTFYRVAKAKRKGTAADAASARRLAAQCAQKLLSPSPMPGSLTAPTIDPRAAARLEDMSQPEEAPSVDATRKRNVSEGAARRQKSN
jgi:hypothetical protein